MPDLLDLTARQVRLPGEDVHRFVRAEQHPDGRVYWTRCGTVMSNVSGAMLTTRDATCDGCCSYGWSR